MPRWRLLACALSLLILVIAAPLAASDADFPFANRAKVPQWPQNLTWLNTAGPLELHDLRGKFVLLDFWTYCCINCMHILPELHKLEQAWPKNLVVIGVHSAKFTDRAGHAEHPRGHPALQDRASGDQRRPATSCGSCSACSRGRRVILIDPEGNAVWGTSGEITFEQVDKVIRAAMPYYRQK